MSENRVGFHQLPCCPFFMTRIYFFENLSREDTASGVWYLYYTESISVLCSVNILNIKCLVVPFCLGPSACVAAGPPT